MTPDERDMLQELANKVAQTPAPPRDAEAEDFIRKSIGSRPDALYLMTQTVLIQNIALQRAQQQIQELQHASQTPVSTGSSFLGGASARPAGYSQPGNPQSQQQYSAPPPPPPPQYAPPAQSVASPGGGCDLLDVWSSRRRIRPLWGRRVFGRRCAYRRSHQ